MPQASLIYCDHDAAYLGVHQSYRVGMMHACGAWELLFRDAFMHQAEIMRS